MKAVALVLLASALLVTGCGRRDAPAAEQTDLPDGNARLDAAAGQAQATGSKATASRSVAYTCEKDLPVTAIYGTDAAGNADLALIVQGQSFTLSQTVSASGSRYATPQGLEAGMGLIWWEKGGTAVLQQVPSEKIADTAAAQTIKTCKEKT